MGFSTEKRMHFNGAMPIVAWTVFIVLLVGSTLYMRHQDMLNQAENEARNYYRLNLAYRSWAARLGGLYARMDRVTPNPHLKVPQRDVSTTGGHNLTLINPAYMTRMVFDTIQKSSPNPVINKITSLKPLNPANAPDPWEREALLQFERGTAVENSQVAELSGKPYLRFISVFLTERPCLECHALQGYKVGDVRGGITISIPLDGYYLSENKTRRGLVAGYLLLWLVGSVGIAASSRRRDAYQEKLRAGEEKFRTVCDWTKDWEYWIDQNGVLKYVSPSCEELTGYSPDAFVAEPDLLIRILHPDDCARFEEHHDAGATAAPPASVEFRIKTKSGEQRWIHHACRPVFSGGICLGRRVSNRDVTERKLVEQELAIRAELLNWVSDSVLVMDLEGKILDANEAAWRTRGYSREELLSMNITEITTAEYQKLVPERLSLIHDTGKAFLESEHRLKDGGTIFVEINTRMIDYRGEPAVLSSIRDVTQRKRTEECLRRSDRFNVSLNRISQAFLTSRSEQEMYQELLVALLEVMESPSGLVGYLDEAGDLVCPAAAVGAAGSLQGSTVFPAHCCGDSNWGDTLWGEALRSGEPRYSNNPQPLPDGHIQVERCLVVPLVCQGRSIALLMVVNRSTDYNDEDLQMLQAIGAQVAPVLQARLEQQQAMAALRDNESRLQVIFDVVQAGIIQFDSAGVVTFANQRMAEMFGTTMDELLGSAYSSHVCPDQREESSLNVRCLLEGEKESAHFERHYLRKDGTDFWGYLTGRRLQGPDDREPMLVATIADLTELKSAEEKRHRSEQQMLHVQKLESLGVLAGGIAHDFNNILLAIMGNTSLALQRIPAESPVEHHLRQVEKAAEKAADLARQMLAYSGKGRFVLEPVDLNRLVREMTSMLEVSLSKKAVLRFYLAKQLPCIVADPTQIRQIVMNLAINASEAIGDTTGVISIATGSRYCDPDYLNQSWLSEELSEGHYVFLEVTDTGCGMSKETVARIFEPFFTTKFTGRGLGMAAILGIVRGHKGAIKVYTEPDKGSSFKILLPATELPVETSSVRSIDGHWRGKGTVLLVDDEETVRDVACEMLKVLGFDVISAIDGREALELYRLKGDQIDLVLMDLNMPNLNGEEAFHELRRIDPQVQVILSSGFSEQEVTRKFLGKGLAGFVQKPYTLSSLKNVVSVVLHDN